MRLELRDLEYFAVIAECGNIGRAAEKLNLSQPALSLSLRRLERLANSTLVARIPKGVELTAAGKTLFERVDKLRLLHDDVAREISDIGKGLSGHLRIGVSVGVCEEIAAIACSALMKEAPRVSLTIEAARTDALRQAVQKGDYDLIVVAAMSEVTPGVTQEQIHLGRLVVHASARHRLARRKKLRPGDLAQEKWAVPFAMTELLPILRKTLVELGSFQPNVAVVSNSMALRARIVAETDLLGFGEEWLVRKFGRQYPLAVINVPDLKFERRTFVMYREGGYLSPVARRLIELLKTVEPEDD